MLSREGKVFIIFFIAFSVTVASTGIFGDFGYSIPDLGLDVEMPDFDKEKLEIGFSDGWEEKNRRGFENNISKVFLTNNYNKKKTVKLSFLFNPRNSESKIKIFKNGSKIDEASVHGRQKLTTNEFEIQPGRNRITISVDECDGKCFYLEKDSFEIIDERKIKEKEPFFSKNWKREAEDRKMDDDAEVQIYNFGRSIKLVRLSFKVVDSNQTGQYVKVMKDGREVDRFDVPDNFKAYTSKPIRLRPGENHVKFSKPENSSIAVKDFEVAEGIENKFYFGKGWYPKEDWYHGSPKDYLNFHWMGNNGTLYFYNKGPERNNLSLSLEASVFHSSKTLLMELNNETIGTESLEMSVDEGRESLLFQNLNLKQGENVIKLSSKEGCGVPSEIKGNKDNRCLSFAVYEIDLGESPNEERDTGRKTINRYFLLTSVFLFFGFSLFLVLKNYSGWKITRKKILILVLLIFLLAFTFRSFQPKTYQLYLDEPWNVEVSTNINEKRTPSICSYRGTEEKCEEYYKPAAYSYYLGLLTSVLGFSLGAIFWNSVVLGSLTCVLIFVLVYTLTERIKLSLLSSVIFSILPMHVFWSTTAESYVTSLFFVLLSLVFLYAYITKEKWLWLIASISTMMLSVTFRIENILLIPVFVLILYSEGYFREFELKDYKDLTAIGIPTIFILVYIRFLHYSANQYLSITRLKLGEITNYLPLMFFMPLTLILLFFGIYLVKNEDRRLFRFLIIWLFVFSPVFVFHTGTGRMVIPLLLALTISVSKILTWFVERLEDERLRITGTLVIIVIVISTGAFFQPEYDDLESKELQTEVVPKVREDVPEECYVIAENPSILAGSETKLISTDYALENDEEIGRMAKDRCVLYFEGIGCKAGLEISGWSRRCGEMKSSYRMEPFESYTNGDLTYELNRVIGSL